MGSDYSDNDDYNYYYTSDGFNDYYGDYNSDYSQVITGDSDDGLDYKFSMDDYNIDDFGMKLDHSFDHSFDRSFDYSFEDYGDYEDYNMVTESHLDQQHPGSKKEDEIINEKEEPKVDLDQVSTETEQSLAENEQNVNKNEQLVERSDESERVNTFQGHTIEAVQEFDESDLMDDDDYQGYGNLGNYLDSTDEEDLWDFYQKLQKDFQEMLEDYNEDYTTNVGGLGENEEG